jgi:hypothetical protein
MQALITDHYDARHILLFLQEVCQWCGWHSFCYAVVFTFYFSMLQYD